MKQQVRVGVLTSLLMAPAVLANANEQINEENINPQQVAEQSAVVHPLAVNAVVNNEIETNDTVEDENGSSQATSNETTVADKQNANMTTADAPVEQESNTADTKTLSDIDEKRIDELKGIGENTLTYVFDKYATWIDDLLGKGIIGVDQAVFLKEKVNYLKGFDDLRKKAKLLNDEINLLKPTNSNTIARVQALTKDLAEIESEFIELRQKFDVQYNIYFKIVTQFVQESANATVLPTYHGNIAKFLVDHISNSATLKKFEQDVIRPGEVISKLAGTISDPVKPEETLAALISYDDHTDSTNSSLVENGTYAQQVKEAYDNFNLFVSSKFSSTEKQILESYQLDDGRTIKQVLDAFQKDLQASANVEKAIVEIDANINALTASQFNSNMKTMLPNYDKLTERQKAMVASYKPLVVGQNMLGAYEVSSSIATLRPSNKDDYRLALYEVNKAYEALDPAAQVYVKNIDILNSHKTDFEKAVGTVTVDPSNNITIDYGDPKSVEGLIKGISEDKVTEAKIADARKAYNALTPVQKRLVNNYKELQNWEKFAKTSLKLIDQIDKIAIENSKKFASDVTKANKALDRLSDEQQQLVTNVPRLHYLTPYATAFTNLNSLRPSNKPEYALKLEAVKAEIEALNELAEADEMKEGDSADLVKLKADLTADLQPKSGDLEAATKVKELIEAAFNETNAVNKLEKISEAREQYNLLSNEQKRVVDNLKTLTAMEKEVSGPLKVMKQIDAVDPGNKTFASKAKSAMNAYDKLSTSMKNYINEDYKAKVENFKRYLELSDLVKALKSSSPTFEKDAEKVRGKLDDLKSSSGWKAVADTDYVPLLIEAAELLEPKVSALEDARSFAEALDEKINSLGALFSSEQFYLLADEIEADYTALSADGKKLVKNYKQFQQLKKDGTAAYKVIEQINNRVIYAEDVASASYEKAVANAIKAYEKLTPNQKRYVYNYSSVLEPQLRIYEVVSMINKLKPTSKTYLDDLNSVRLAYEALSEEDKKKLEPIYYKLTNGEVGVEEVRKVIQLINDAVPGSEDYVKKLQEARTAYDQLATISSSYQKLVTNYKTLQDREKAMKPVMDSVYQIQELQELIVRPLNDAATFVRKYNAAVKAYEKVPYESRHLIHNRHVLLSEIYPVASTMEAILNIKASSKTFSTDVQKAREWYDNLNSADKALVTNYSSLVAFEQIVSGGNEVDSMIAQIPKTPISGYLQAIKNARAAYNALLPDEKRAVVLYKELQNYEKGVKNVLAAIDAIDNIQNASNLISAYDKAIKALDKLTADERQMIPNMSKLQSVGPAIEVYKQIQSLKPSQENYAGSVQAIYAAYNRLSTVEKQYVTNFAQLQEAKNNVDNLATVIAKISTIQPGTRNYARDVQEALALYNTLPAALKKLVTNADMLKNSEKEITAAEKVRAMIMEIDVNAANFVEKTLAARNAYDKLTSNEKRLVSNYFLLEDFEYELGNMF